MRKASRKMIGAAAVTCSAASAAAVNLASIADPGLQ